MAGLLVLGWLAWMVYLRVAQRAHP
jgi:hypothetical protein